MSAHSHSHDHGHHHGVSVQQAASKAFQIGIALNLLYVIAELVAGFTNHSLALITDAGHNFSDVISLALSLLAFRLTKVKPTKTFTYGYKKTTILAALANATILLVTVGILGYECVMRLKVPQVVEGGYIAIIAGIGILVNGISAFLFFKTQKHELNARGAYLHLLTDAAVSAGVVISGIIIKYTGWYWLDPAMGIAILLVILLGTWSLLTESLRLSLDAVPKGVEISEVEEIIKKVKGVAGVHHIHVWAMSTTENALTAHVVLMAEATEAKQKVVSNIKHDLMHYNIQHITIEVEEGDCGDVVCLTEVAKVTH